LNPDAADAPLHGRRFVVTRPVGQAHTLSAPLRALGGEVIEAPAIRIEPPEDFGPLDRAIARLDAYDWILFTSVNGVEAFFERAQKRPSARLATIGPATREALSHHGLKSDVTPERFVAESLFEALDDMVDLTGLEMLLPRADIARQALPNLLTAAGATVDVVPAYRTVLAHDDVRRAMSLLREETIDAVTFTSGSTVRSFFTNADALVRSRAVAASIGPITSLALREQRVEPAIEAREYTSEGLVRAIREHFTEEN